MSIAKAAAPATKKKPARSAAPADALALLTADHKEVVQSICEMLTAHATIEEEIFYPALREAPDATVKDLVSHLEAMNPDDDLYNAKATVLGDISSIRSRKKRTRFSPKRAKRKSISHSWAPSCRHARKS